MQFLILALSVLLTAAVCDIRRRKLPYWVLLAAAGISVLITAVDLTDHMFDLSDFGLSLCPGGLLLLLAFISNQSIGYGDGLLILGIGPAFGPVPLLAGICLAFFFSAAASLFLLVLRRATRKTKLPFVPFFASAMGVIVLALA